MMKQKYRKQTESLTDTVHKRYSVLEKSTAVMENQKQPSIKKGIQKNKADMFGECLKVKKINKIGNYHLSMTKQSIK